MADDYKRMRAERRRRQRDIVTRSKAVIPEVPQVLVSVPPSKPILPEAFKTVELSSSGFACPYPGCNQVSSNRQSKVYYGRLPYLRNIRRFFFVSLRVMELNKR